MGKNKKTTFSFIRWVWRALICRLWRMVKLRAMSPEEQFDSMKKLVDSGDVQKIQDLLRAGYRLNQEKDGMNFVRYLLQSDIIKDPKNEIWPTVSRQIKKYSRPALIKMCKDIIDSDGNRCSGQKRRTGSKWPPGSDWRDFIYPFVLIAEENKNQLKPHTLELLKYAACHQEWAVVCILHNYVCTVDQNELRQLVLDCIKAEDNVGVHALTENINELEPHALELLEYATEDKQWEICEIINRNCEIGPDKLRKLALNHIKKGGRSSEIDKLIKLDEKIFNKPVKVDPDELRKLILDCIKASDSLGIKILTAPDEYSSLKSITLDDEDNNAFFSAVKLDKKNVLADLLTNNKDKIVLVEDFYKGDVSIFHYAVLQGSAGCIKILDGYISDWETETCLKYPDLSPLALAERYGDKNDEHKEIVSLLKELQRNHPARRRKKLEKLLSSEGLNKMESCLDSCLDLPWEQIAHMGKETRGCLESKAIKLGESDNSYAIRDYLKFALDQPWDEWGKILPRETREYFNKKIAELGEDPNDSKLRGYIKLLFNLPWDKRSRLNNDYNSAKRVLDEDHQGLDVAKKKAIGIIVTQLQAQKAGKPTAKSSITCLNGPPGIGKSTFVKIIAKALGRKFQTIALGGVQDVAIVRGHSLTYVGSKYGKIMDAIIKSGVKNPLLLLDEIDKIGATNAQGDVSAALLEVLDSNQNKVFTDDYFGVPFDLSEVFFIATSNDKEKIAPPLRSRMDMLDLPGYDNDAKFKIVKEHLVSRTLNDLNMVGEAFPHKVTITDEAIREMITSYTQEEGIRELEKLVNKLFTEILEKTFSEGTLDDSPRNFVIEKDDISRMLGPPTNKYHNSATIADHPNPDGAHTKSR